MIRVPRLARLAGVCALVLSALALGVAPADAVTSSPASTNPTGSFEVVTPGTATLTYSGFAPGTAVVFFYDEMDECPDPSGVGISQKPLYSIGLGSGPALGASPFVISQGAAVKTGFEGASTTLPGGRYRLCLFNVATSTQVYLIANTATPIFNPITSSFVANSDGTITLTYANANKDLSQEGQLYLLAGATECPANMDATTASGFAWTFGSPATLVPYEPPSGTVIGVGTMGVKLPIDPSTYLILEKPVTAGTYQVCLYQTNSEESMALHQSQSNVSVAPVAPVEPAFTG